MTQAYSTLSQENETLHQQIIDGVEYVDGLKVGGFIGNEYYIDFYTSSELTETNQFNFKYSNINDFAGFSTSYLRDYIGMFGVSIFRYIDMYSIVSQDGDSYDFYGRSYSYSASNNCITTINWIDINGNSFDFDNYTGDTIYLKINTPQYELTEVDGQTLLNSLTLTFVVDTNI